jgi:hypothetical protein
MTSERKWVCPQCDGDDWDADRPGGWHYRGTVGYHPRVPVTEKIRLDKRIRMRYTSNSL